MRFSKADSVSNNYIRKYETFLRASKEASKAAQMATAQHVNLQLEATPSFEKPREPQMKPFIRKSKEKKDEFEFVIDEDLLKFYEESLRFKKERSKCIESQV